MSGSATGVRQALGTVSARVGSLLLGTIASVAVARSLQPAGRGTYHLIATIAGTAIALGHLSIEQAQTTFWSDVRHRRAVAANAVTLGLLVGGLAMLAALAVVFAAGQALRPLHPGIVVLALVGVPLGVCGLYVTNVALLQGRAYLVNRAGLAGAGVQCAALTALGLAGRLTVGAVIAVWVCSTALPCCAIAALGRLGARRPDLAIAWRTVVTGLSYHLGPASVFLLLRVDVFILAAHGSARLVGVYSLAVSVAELSRFAADSVSQVALSRQARASRDESADVTARMTRLNVLTGVASVCGLAAAAPILVPAAYGRSFADAVPLVLLLAPGVLALGAARPASAFLLRLRSPRCVVGPALAGLAVNVALNAALIPGLGAAGCSIASSAGYLLMAALQIRLFLRASGASGRSLLPGRADLREFTTGLCAARRRIRCSRSRRRRSSGGAGRSPGRAPG